jgi:hypothetical protein
MRAVEREPLVARGRRGHVSRDVVVPVDGADARDAARRAERDAAAGHATQS